MNKPIFLLGFMSSGKSRLGKQLAKRLNIPFFDLDKEIEAREHKSISQIFEDRGEEAFREIEVEVLRELPLDKPSVISLGGGTPAFHDNMEYVLENGLSFYLEVDEKYLVGRLKERKQRRPLVKNLSDEALKSFVNETLKRRTHFYKKANFIISSNKPSVKDILEKLNA